jgi:hypothetical protein
VEARRAGLAAAHMRPLAAFAASLREATGNEVPDADPADGGVRARCLLLLETPGPAILRTGFVSCDNPAPTAGNLRRFLRDAGLPREALLIWNAVPFVIHAPGARNRAPRASEVRRGLALLPGLLALLPALRVCVLAGRAAARRARCCARSAGPALLEMPHPSPTYVCTSPEVPRRIVAALRRRRRGLARRRSRRDPRARHRRRRLHRQPRRARVLDAGIGRGARRPFTGVRERRPPGVPFVQGSTASGAAGAVSAATAFRVLHFAAIPWWCRKAWPDRLDTGANNVANKPRLAQGCVDAGIRRLVFSSTAAVYGVPASPLVDEDTPCAPINPYGASKLAAERALADAGMRARPMHRGAALLQRRRRRPRRPRRAAPPRRHPPGQGGLRSGARKRRPWRCSARTTPRRTAPACATTST